MKRSVLGLAAVVLLGSVGQVQASPITYTLSSAVSGTLGGSPFTNALVTVTLTGDTANVMPGPAPFTDVVVNSGTATVNVSGIGSGAFTDSIVVVDTLADTSLLGGPAVLMLDETTGTGILLQTGSVFTTYDLRSSLAVAGTGGVASGSHVTPVFPTTAGDLTWTVGQSLGSSTFTAAVATPEPGTLAFIGAGLAVIVWRRRSKQRAHHAPDAV